MWIGISLMRWNWWIGSTLSAATLHPRQSRTRLQCQFCACESASLFFRVARLLALSELRHKPRRAQDIEHAGAKAQQQADNQTPWRGSRQTVQEPTKTNAHHYAGDELAG